MIFFSNSIISKKIILSRPWVQLVLVFFLICLLRFFPFFFQSKALIFGDNYSLMVPGKLFTAHWLRKGVFPLWNPTILGGIPWIGDVNQSVLYPSTLIFALFKPATALNWTVILHLFLTFLGMYFAAKRWLKSKESHFFALIAAILWTLSSQITGSINNLSTIQSLAWMPWVVYFGLRVTKAFKSKIWFAVVVLFQFAGGYPQHVIYSILTAVLLNVLAGLNKTNFWFWLKNWVLTAILSIALSAVIWLPFLETLLNSTRMIQSGNQSLTGSLHPAELIKLVLPYFFDCPAQGMKWGPSWNSVPNVAFFIPWVGLFVLIVYLLSVLKKKLGINKEILILGLACFMGVFFSLGKYLPINLSGLLKASRGPSIVLIAVNFLLILLLVKAWEEIQKNNVLLSVVKVVKSKLGLAIISFSFLCLLLISKFNYFWQLADTISNNFLTLSVFHTLKRDKIISQIIVVNLLVNSSLLLINLEMIAKKKANQVSRLILLALLVVEMFFNTQAMLLFAPNKVYSIDQPVFEREDYQARWLTRNSNYPYTDYNSFWDALVVRQPFSDSFVDDSQLKTYDHLINLKKGLTPDWNMPLNYNLVHGYTTLLPQDYAKIWAKSDQAGINLIDQIDLSSQRDQSFLRKWAVKYYLVDNWFNIEESYSPFKKLEEKERWSLYQLPAFPRFRYFDGKKKNEAPLDLEIEENPNKIVLAFDNKNGAEHLIVADRYDKNWQATVNGNKVNIENYNSLRKIKIMSGVNHLQLIYRPKFFYLGQAVSLFTGFVSMLIILLKKKIST